MKKNAKRKQGGVVKPITIVGSRQAVENAIDASKSSPPRSWGASARAVRTSGAKTKACY